VRTVIELTAFFDWYMKEYEAADFEGTCGVTYGEAVHDCGVDGGYAAVWVVCGLASVIARPIVAVYPTLNNDADDDVIGSLLNRVHKPRMNSSDDDEIRIMWTRTAPPRT